MSRKSICVAEGVQKARLVGYRHHNNKPERTRRFYERYRCRGCGKNITKDKLHKGISRILNRTELIIDDRGEFLDSMRKAWQAEVSNIFETIARLKQKHTLLTAEKDNLVRTMAGNPELADDFKGSIATIKAEI